MYLKSLVIAIFSLATLALSAQPGNKSIRLKPSKSFTVQPSVSLINGIPVVTSTALPEPCGTTGLMEDLIKEHPEFAKQIQEQEERLQKYLRLPKPLGPTPTYTIPVVIHIFHTGQAEGAIDAVYKACGGGTIIANPSAAQLRGSIDQINKDYAGIGTNPAGMARNTRAAEVGIKFVLATIDPNGVSMPTGAITRRDGSLASTWTGAVAAGQEAATASAYAANGINRSNTNGVPEGTLSKVVKWPPSKYYNIYLVTEIDNNNSACGTQGFAYFPGSCSTSNSNGTDYAVMIPSSFDGSKNSISTFDHEFGHALSLNHTFHNGSGAEDPNGNTCPSSETDCTKQGDFICDIPPHKSMLGKGCQQDNTAGSCGVGVFGQYQDNYMNYTNCGPTFFSQDQADRMRSTLATDGCRKNQSSTKNLKEVGGDGNTPPYAQIKAFNTHPCVGLPVRFEDASLYSPTSWAWSTLQAGPIIAPSPSGSFVNITFNSTGTFTVRLLVTNAYGNDQTSGTRDVTVIVDPAVSVPYTETFKSNTVFPPNGWSRTELPASSSEDKWKVSTANFDAGGTFPTDYSAVLKDGQVIDDAGENYLQSPAFDLSTVASPLLSFYRSYRNCYGSYGDSLLIQVSSDCGASFTTVYTLSPSELNTAPYSPSGCPGSIPSASYQDFDPGINNSAYWKKDEVDLAPYISKNVVIRFSRHPAVNGASGAIYLDDINIDDTPKAPIADFSFDPNGCTNTDVTFTDKSKNHPTAWSWSFEGATPTTSGNQSPTVSYTTPGTYGVTLTVTNSVGSDTKYGSIIVNEGPSVQITTNPGNTICAGQSATLTASGADTYLWSTSEGSSTIVVTPTANTTYTVSATKSSTGCKAVKNVSIAVIDFAGIGGFAGTDKVIFAGDTVKIGTTASYSDYSYSWSNASTLDDPNIAEPVANPGSTTTYSLTITNKIAGCKQTDKVEVLVLPDPIINPNPAQVCAGGSPTFVVSNAYPSNTYLWSDASTTTSFFVAPPVSTNTFYTVTVTTSSDKARTASAQVNIKGPAAGFDFTVAPSCTGTATVSFTNTTSYAINPTYTWAGLGTPPTSSAVNPITTYTAVGTYVVTLTVIDASGCAPSEAFKTVYISDTPPTVAFNPITPDAGAADNFCSGSTLNFSYTATGDINSVDWKFDQGNKSSTLTSPSFSYLPNGATPGSTIYTVTVTVNNSCGSTFDTHAITILNTATPTITSSPTSPVCYNSVLTLDSGLPNDPDFTFDWKPGSLFTSPNGPTMTTVPITGSSTFTLDLTTNYPSVPGASCSASSSLVVDVKPNTIAIPNVTANKSTVCKNEDLVLSAYLPDATATYTWIANPTGSAPVLSPPYNKKATFNPILNTTYTVIATNSCGLTSSASIAVKVNNQQDVLVTSSGGQVICPGSSKQLLANNPDAIKYKWNYKNSSSAVIEVSDAGFYTVSTTDNLGCISTGGIALSKDLNTIKLSAANTQLCTDDKTDIYFEASANTQVGKITWYPGSIPGTSPTLANVGGGDYYVIVQNLNSGCDLSSNTVTINEVLVPPVIPITIKGGGTGNICQSDSVVLEAYPVVGASYTWYRLGVMVPNPSIPNELPIFETSPGQVDYTVEVKFGTCATKSGSISLEVMPTPVFTILSSPTFLPGNPISVCNGETVKLFSTINGGNFNFLWMPTGETTPSITASFASIYTLKVTNPINSCSYVQSIDVDIKDKPNTTITANRPLGNGPVILCQGESVTFTAAQNNSYLWLPSGIATRTLTVNSSGTYVLKVTNAYGCTALSEVIEVQVKALPVAQIISPTQDVTICEGNTVKLIASDASNWDWSDGQKTKEITVSTSGTYVVTISNNNSCSKESNPIVVTVIPKPTVSFVLPANNADTVKICFTSGTTLKVQVQAGFTYQWLKDGLPISGANGSTFNTSTQGNYAIKISNQCGEIISKGIYVQVDEIPDPKAITLDEPNICQGDSVTLVGYNSVGQYNWLLNGTLIPGATSATYIAKDPGRYNFQVTNACAPTGKTSLPIDVLVSSTPSATFNVIGNLTICPGSGGPLLIAASGPGYTYQWKKDGYNISGATTDKYAVVSGGTYTLVIKNPCGVAYAAQSVTVKEYFAPTVTKKTSAEKLKLCAGESVDLVVDVQGSYNQYHWILYTGDPLNPMQDLGNMNINTFKANQSGIYGVVVENSCGPVTYSAPYTVVVNPAPSFTLLPAAGSTLSICKGGSTELSVIGFDIVDRKWSNGSKQPILTVSTPGQYAVTVTNSYGCKQTALPITIFVDNSLVADFDYTVYPNSSPVAVAFNNKSEKAGNIYTWSFGDNYKSIEPNPTHTYGSKTDYKVKLTVTTAAGCVDSITKIIKLQNSEKMMPSLFTPNNDGKNDLFTPMYESVSVIRCQVFDRWGKKVFEWSGNENAWSGRTLQGEDAREGTYFYVLEGKVRNKNGILEPITEKGYVTLMRSDK